MVAMVGWPGRAISAGVLPLIHPSQLSCGILPSGTFTFLI